MKCERCGTSSPNGTKFCISCGEKLPDGTGCTNCDHELAYGSKYCIKCGQKVPKGTYDAEYNETIWAKIDQLKDGYDSLAFKKITGNIVFKLVLFFSALVYLFFSLHGNFNGIRLKDNEAYTIQYNKKMDEYYISPKKISANLELYAPAGTENLVFTAIIDEKEVNVKKYTTKEYKKEGYRVETNEYEYILIEALRNGKTVDTVKIIVVEK